MSEVIAGPSLVAREDSFLRQSHMEAEQLECAERKIRVLLERSRVPEDSGHAENTLKWVLLLRPDADPALRLAAIAHDVSVGSIVAGGS